MVNSACVPACLLHAEKPTYSKVLQYSEVVLELSASNLKALYRKGVALYHLKEAERALDVLRKAHSLPQGNKGMNTSLKAGPHDPANWIAQVGSNSYYPADSIHQI